MEKEIKLYRNFKKSRRLLFTTGATCIVLLLTFLYCVGIFDEQFRVKPAVISGGFLLVILFMMVSNLLQLRDKSARVILNETHFFGKTTPISKAFGLGEWIDVANIGLQKVGGDTLVIVTLTNISKYKGRLPKMLWKMAYDAQRDELNIMYSSSEIDVDAKQLFDLFTSYWKNTKMNS